MSNKNNGFSLIELSIVLVIISLLTVGALGGKKLIIHAKVISVINQWMDWKTSIYAFKVARSGLPGDVNDNGKIGYIQDGVAYEATGDYCNNCGHYTGEYATKAVGTVAGPWVDLYLAKLSNFKPDPSSSYLSSIWWPNDNYINTVLPVSKLHSSESKVYFYFRVENLYLAEVDIKFSFIPKILRDIDKKIDDGLIASGNVVSVCNTTLDDLSLEGITEGTQNTTYEDIIDNNIGCGSISYSILNN
jgi:prepilin-type N-terminal cleavage/methylation domain-containing protein